jgi:hypothetical protein
LFDKPRIISLFNNETNSFQGEIRKTFTEMLEDKERERVELQAELEQLQAEVEQLKLEAENEEVNRLQAQEPVR